MDDFSLSNLQESRNEWCARLVNILAPMMSEGFRSIFDEAWKLCEQNNETGKYLMTFQNFLSRVPKWNATIIEQETQRIVDRSGCGYLADLVTCVHIIQLKSLTCMRVGTKQKKVDIDVPSLNEFIHKVYVHCARKLYTNVYLFERGIPPLSVQKNGRELEIIIKECILDSIRDSIPLELILKTYMDETIEDHTEVKIKEEIVSQEAVVDEAAAQQSQQQQQQQPAQSQSDSVPTAAAIATGQASRQAATPACTASAASPCGTCCTAPTPPQTAQRRRPLLPLLLSNSTTWTAPLTQTMQNTSFMHPRRRSGWNKSARSATCSASCRKRKMMKTRWTESILAKTCSWTCLTCSPLKNPTKS